MKKFIIVLLIGIGLWWGLTHTARDSGKGHVTTRGTISAGEKVDLLKYLDPAKFTVFFFYANW